MPPVEDHEVHEKTRFDSSARYGCFNREKYEDSYLAIVRKFGPDGELTHVGPEVVESRMSKECRYDMSLTDGWCDGCKHRGSGEAYDKRVRESGK